ncbi:MAG: endonuclease [Chitinophagales bacterium]
MRGILRSLVSTLTLTTALTVSAAEPASNPTNFSSSAVKAWGFAIKFNPVVANGFLVLKSEQNISSTPADGTVYQKGTWIGNAKVAYVGTADSIWIREVLLNHTYHFSVFAYSGSGSSIDYKQTAPLTGTVTAAGSSMGNYYGSIVPGSNFITSLTNLIHPHTQVNYLNGMYDLADVYYSHDTTLGREFVQCQYSGEKYIYTPPLNIGNINYNREHTLPKSWMRTYATYGSSITDYPEGSDYHMLFLTNGDVNNARLNYAYGTVATTTYSYQNFKLGKNSSNVTVAEPQNTTKGDAARAMMYTIICYNGTDGSWALQNLLSHGPDEVDALLKQWNSADPVSEEELTRHEYVVSRQHNRNPFIDHPEWADCIDFKALLTKACISGVPEISDNDIQVYPIPAQDILEIETPAAVSSVVIYNSLGEISNAPVQYTSATHITLNISDLQAGNYWVRLESDGRYFTRAILIAP